MADAKKPWCDGPFELISASLAHDSKDSPAQGSDRMAAEMALIHNLLIRGINSIYLQCVNVGGPRGTPQDRADFARFSLQWARLIAGHHDGEEADIFPDIERLVGEPGLMATNVAEHAAFHGGLGAFVAYLEGVVAGGETYDGERVRALVDAFMPALRTHLANEIPTLSALGRYGDKVDWEKWHKETTGRIVDKQMKTAEYRNETCAFMFILHDKTFEDGVWESFPPVPWLVGSAMRWLFFWKHDNWWRFAGCGYDSMPRELPFA